MKFGYTILYVRDVQTSLAFYQSAFGLEQKFLHESGTYGELATGETTLAFATAEVLDATNLPAGQPDAAAPVLEIALVTEDVQAAFDAALAAGAAEVSPPKDTPWGQTVAYVADTDGFWVELCTPVPPG